MKKNIFLISSLLVVMLASTTVVLHSLQNKVMVQIHGIITDQSNKPFSTDLYFINSEGQKIRTKSNPEDGVYQQILASGDNYYMIFKDYTPVNNERLVNIPQSTEYVEHTKNIKLQGLEAGMELLRFKGFEPNETKANSDALHSLLFVKHFISVNPGATLELVISSADCNFKPEQKKVDVYNKKTNKLTQQTKKLNPAEMLSECRKERLKNIKLKLGELQVYLKDECYKEDTKMPAPPKKAPAPPKIKKGSKTAPVVQPQPTTPGNVTIRIKSYSKL